MIWHDIYKTSQTTSQLHIKKKYINMHVVDVESLENFFNQVSHQKWIVTKQKCKSDGKLQA